MTFLLLSTALLPVIILITFIYRKDKAAPEPWSALLLAFGAGVLSTLVSFGFSMPFQELGLYPEEIHSFWDGVRTAFFGAAIPEEIAKLIMLWLVLRRNKHFDERMDGIVYAVCVTLGFAGLENILYLVGSEDWIGTGISRAIFAVPGHFCDGILMGYYYSLAHFSPTHKTKNRVLTLVAPILAHGIYDSLLMVSDQVPEVVSVLLLIAFYGFCFMTWKYCNKQIAKHAKTDKIDRMVDSVKDFFE